MSPFSIDLSKSPSQDAQKPTRHSDLTGHPLLRKSFSTSSSPRKLNGQNVLEKYNQLETLGHGSYGTVKLVEKKEDGKRFAMKVI